MVEIINSGEVLTPTDQGAVAHALRCQHARQTWQRQEGYYLTRCVDCERILEATVIPGNLRHA
jgi:hypothetical protein